jgi:DNA-binding NtrC family response regulator/tetratricopeptide (TPR) repeat protein
MARAIREATILQPGRATTMALLADRFVVDEDQPSLDLATGDCVVVAISSAGAESEERQWALRCDGLQKLHHPSIARLLDYGAVGESKRFEAWRCGERWRGPSGEAEARCARASTVLHACGLLSGSLTPTSVRSSRSGPVVLPVAEAGYPSPCPDEELRDLRLDDRAISALPRRAVAAMSELFERSCGTRPHVAALWGPAGAGTRTVIDDLARMARLSGFVPVAAHVLPAFSDRLRGRSLFVIDAEGRRFGWSVLLGAALASPRPHVLLFVGREEVPGVDGIALEPFTIDALAGAVCPGPSTDPQAARVRRLAAGAGGWPGRFARLLWRSTTSRDAGLDRRAEILRSPKPGPLRAAEQAVIYGGDEELPVGATGLRRSVPEATELAALARRVDTGVQLIAHGRHAPGERVLRQAIGGLSRRGDWAHAGQGSVALARMLLRRGRVREAQTTLECAADQSRRGGDVSRLIDIAILGGVALTDLARTDEAETALSAALAAARSGHDGARVALALTALARALFWQARYDEADQALRSIDEIRSSAEAALGVSSIAVAIAVGTRNLDLAVSRGTVAVAGAQQSGDSHLLADAAYGAAFAHLAVGDVGAVERDVAICVTAARVSHDPLLAARGRLILVEALRRSGRRSAAARLLDRISRVGSATVPPIVRNRGDLLRELLSSDAPAHEIVARHVASTGLGALALYVPSSRAIRRGGPPDPMVDAIVDILDVCQTAEDEDAVLAEVCRRIRSRVRAVAMACAAVQADGCTVITSDGGRIEPAIAERVVAAGIAIAPHRCHERIESGVPIRYGGTIVGALVARWTIGTPHDLSQAAALLTAAAAAVAPILSAAVARRRRPAASGMAELMGASAAMAELRLAVERAAAAPFAVLVEGESGSGKELVARALHRCGPRRDRPFCTVNCAALPDDLLEAELFGHVRGAFTGAIAERVGVFEEAHGGTLLMDEIGELSPRAQAKVLRVIQEGELRRIGENVSRRVNVRVVSATNRDLRQEVAAGRFRLDLLYRLDVIRIGVPPLRERREDIVVLSEHFWRDAAARVGSRATLAAATLGALGRYDWPGNVRELQNVLASLAVRSPRRGVVPPSALGPQFGHRGFTETARLDEARRTFEDRFVRAALVRNGGQRLRTAAELGVTRQGLTKLMARLGID